MRENLGVASVGVAVAQLQAAASTLAVSRASVGRTIFYYFFLEFGPGPLVPVSVPINPAIKGLGGFSLGSPVPVGKLGQQGFPKPSQPGQINVSVLVTPSFVFGL